jgi:hypothetical protein
MPPATRTLTDTAATRIVRAELMAMAAAVAASPGRRETLRMVHPRISEQRLEDEWRSAAAVLRPNVVARLSLQVIFPDGRTRLFGSQRRAAAPPKPRERPRPGGHVRLPARDLSFAVEKLLVWAWLTRKGPLTRTWLERTVGCSYPTVAAVVRRLGSALLRHPDRRIELKLVSREQWARLFVLSREARAPMRFVDRSGQPATAAELLRRLAELAPRGIALGGVEGARYYHPRLDLLGLPRLDLSVHAPERHADIAFLRRLDPALEPTTDSASPALLVLHFVRHRETLFTAAPGALPWADPVECLLDLEEAGLEAQALEFLDALAPSGRRGR